MQELRIQNRLRKLTVTMAILNKLAITKRPIVAKVVAFTASMTSEACVESRFDWYRPHREKMKCHTSNTPAKIAKFESLTRIEKKAAGVIFLPDSDTVRTVVSPKDRIRRPEYRNLRDPKSKRRLAVFTKEGLGSD
jgi:hypothetical protein